jgi:hypothetical protein
MPSSAAAAAIFSSAIAPFGSWTAQTNVPTRFGRRDGYALAPLPVGSSAASAQLHVEPPTPPVHANDEPSQIGVAGEQQTGTVGRLQTGRGAEPPQRLRVAARPRVEGADRGRALRGAGGRLPPDSLCHDPPRSDTWAARQDGQRKRSPARRRPAPGDPSRGWAFRQRTSVSLARGSRSGSGATRRSPGS